LVLVVVLGVPTERLLHIGGHRESDSISEDRKLNLICSEKTSSGNPIGQRVEFVYNAFLYSHPEDLVVCDVRVVLELDSQCYLVKADVSIRDSSEHQRWCSVVIC
jgi:hypothetical protein